ncbi:hypothetical protein MASR1M101_37270 [Gemmatimonas sp.]
MGGGLTFLIRICAALLLGALAVPSRPAVVASLAEEISVAIGGTHGAWCLSHASEAVHGGPHSHSWCRCASRRHQRGQDGVLPTLHLAGSIPALDPLNEERGSWRVSASVPTSITGRSAASPRAPPALN